MNYFSSSYFFPEKKLEKMVLYFVLLVVGLGIFFSHVYPSFFEENWITDNGWVELFTILGMVLIILVNVYRTNILYPFRSNLFIVCTWLLAFAFFFGLGEKLSWGQNIFDFQAPSFFVRYNVHGEINLHHLKFGNWGMGKIIFNQLMKPMIIFYVLILPLLYDKFNTVKNLVDALALPLPRLYHTLAYVLLILMCQTVDRGRNEEILEFGGIWLVLLMFCRPYNRKLFSRVSFNR